MWLLIGIIVIVSVSPLLGGLYAAHAERRQEREQIRSVMQRQERGRKSSLTG
jgi:hypothetical protein